MSPQIRTDARTGSRLLTIGNRQPSLVAFAMATCLVVTSGCVALSIPSKRFHDPADHGGLFGDYRKGGSVGVPDNLADHDGHFHDGDVVEGHCTESYSASGYSENDDEFDEDEFGTGCHGHQKAPEVPWPRYHPVPTRPVFSGYPGSQQ